MKRLVIFLFCILLLNTALATDYYVSTTGSNSHPGTIGQPFRTIQHAIDNMAGGDTIYLRGGTYQEGAITIPQSKDGTLDSYSTLMSYPDEWAVLDGQNNCGTRGGVIGRRDWDKDGSTDIKYWKFERLEIKNGASTSRDAASGIWANGGPFIVRYCYIHDNLANSGGENPGGIKGMIWHDSIVEYNHFKDNGVDDGSNEHHSAISLHIHGDYRHSPSYWETAPYDIDHTTRKNTIRYNLVENTKKVAKYGYHNKGRQYFAHKTDVTWDYKNFGDKIHNNIFLNTTIGVGCQQDFQQIYNNVIIVPPQTHSELGITITDVTLSGNMMGVTVYNNYIQNGRVMVNFGFGENYVVNPYIYIFNNILDNAPSNYDSAAVINLGQTYMQRPFEYDSSRTEISNNYFYNVNSDDIKVTRNNENCRSYLSVNEYDGCFETNNYLSESSGLFQGTSESLKYKTIQSHVLEGSTTIANGGIGGSHPYLSGVTIPSYVGHCPNDACSWVDEVLALENLGSGYNPPNPECPDGTCNGDETCSSCPADCPTLSGQVCCSGIIYTGDCCSDPDCASPDTCTNHICSTQSCTESWTCTDWTTCADNQQTRTCTDANNCGTTNDRPELTQSCTTGDETILNYNYIEDTYININDEINANSEYLNTYTWPENTITNAILMKFDLSTISEEVTNAKLKLYFSDMEGDGGDNNYQLTTHRIINKNPIISEANGYDSSSGISWTPTGEDVPLAQGDINSATGTVSISKTFGWYEFDVTNIINYWLNNPGENFGLLINSDSSASEDSNRIFVSTENSNTNQRPELILQFEENSFYSDLDNDGDVDLDDFEILNTGYGTTYSLMDLTLMGKDFENS